MTENTTDKVLSLLSFHKQGKIETKIRKQRTNTDCAPFFSLLFSFFWNHRAVEIIKIKQNNHLGVLAGVCRFRAGAGGLFDFIVLQSNRRSRGRKKVCPTTSDLRIRCSVPGKFIFGFNSSWVACCCCQRLYLSGG